MKGIEIFTEQKCLFDSVEDLLKSKPYIFLSLIYGDLRVVTSAKSGFLRLEKTKSGKVLVTESCYYESPLEGELIGYVVPTLAPGNADTPVVNSGNGKTLSKFGVITSHMDIPKSVREVVRTASYEDYTPEDDLDKLKTVINIDLEKPVEREVVDESFKNLVLDGGEQ